MSDLRRDLKKKNPFESAAAEVVVSILRTNELFQHRFGQLFRQFDLNQPQYNILRILYGEGQPLPALEIASRMVSVVPAITGLVDKLEKKGLVERRRCERDRRVCYVGLTQHGTQLVEQLRDPNESLHQELAGHLSDGESKELLRLLEKARKSVARDNSDN